MVCCFVVPRGGLRYGVLLCDAERYAEVCCAVVWCWEVSLDMVCSCMMLGGGKSYNVLMCCAGRFPDLW